MKWTETSTTRDNAIRAIGSRKLKLGVEKRGAGTLISMIGARGQDWPSRGGGRRSHFSGSRKSRRLQMFAGTDTPPRVVRVVFALRNFCDDCSSRGRSDEPS